MHKRELVVTTLLSLMLAAQARPPTMLPNVSKLSFWCGARAFESDDCTTGEIIEGGSMFGFIKDICVGGTSSARSLQIDPGGRFCRYKAFYLNQCDGQGGVGKGSACLCMHSYSRAAAQQKFTTNRHTHMREELAYDLLLAVGQWNHLDAGKCIQVALDSGTVFSSLGIYW